MKKRCLCVLFALLTGLLCLPVTAYPEPANAHVAKIESTISASLGKDTPGAAAVLIENGTVTLMEGFGYADLNTQKLVTPDTVFEIGDISTSFVSVSAMILAKEGRLDVDADIAAYLPADFMKNLNLSYPVSVRQLLTHRAGFGGRIFDLSFKKDIYRFETLREALLADVPEQVLLPDVCAIPSPFGIALAAYVVETVTGESYESYATAHILSPLGMTSTVLLPTAKTEPAEAAVGYHTSETGLFSVPGNGSRNYAGLYPATGALSTAADLSQYLSFLLSADGAPILDETYMSQLFQISYCGILPQTALGFSADPPSFYLTGETACFGAYLAFNRNEHTGVLVLTNTAGSALRDLPRSVCSGTQVIAYSEEALYDLKIYKGYYTDASGERRTFVGRLKGVGEDIGASVGDDGYLHFLGLRLRQIAPGVFADADGPENEVRVQFLFNEEGKVACAVTSTGECYMPIPFYLSHRPAILMLAFLLILAVWFLVSGIFNLLCLIFQRDREEHSLRFSIPGIFAALLSITVLIQAFVGYRFGSDVLSSFFYAMSVLALLFGTAATVSYLIAFLSSVTDRRTHKRLAYTAVLFVCYALLVYFFGLSYF